MSPMNNRLMVPRKTPGLLDLVPGAAAAYSLRSLSNSYADPVVTVRRSSDDAEEDFTASEVADGTLAAFCGAGDGFVKQWWDQSGNARHAVAAADTNEPKIVDSGVVILEDGNPAIQFDGTDDVLATSAIATATAASAFLACSANLWNPTGGYRGAMSHAYNADSNVGVVFATLPNTTFHDWLQGDVYAFGSGFLSTQYPRANGPMPSGSDLRLIATFLSPATAEIRVDGAIVSTRVSQTGSNASKSGSILVGAGRVGAEYWQGAILEAIYYQSDVSSQKELAEGLIAWSYS